MIKNISHDLFTLKPSYRCCSIWTSQTHTNYSFYLMNNPANSLSQQRSMKLSPKLTSQNEANTLPEPVVLLQDTIRPIRLFTSPKGICTELWLTQIHHLILYITTWEMYKHVSNFPISWLSFYMVWPMHSFSLLNTFGLIFQISDSMVSLYKLQSSSPIC